MDASSARKQLFELSRKRETLRQNLMSFRNPMVEGSLVERPVTCGKKGCRCRKGKPHGPFVYLVRKREGRSVWSYLGKASQGPLAEAVRRHQRFAALVQEYRGLCREEEACLQALEEALTVDAASLSKRIKTEVEK